MIRHYLFYGLGLLLVLFLGVVFIHSYESDPGLVPREQRIEFENNRNICHGIDIPLTDVFSFGTAFSEAPSSNLCIGLLEKGNSITLHPDVAPY